MEMILLIAYFVMSGATLAKMYLYYGIRGFSLLHAFYMPLEVLTKYPLWISILIGTHYRKKE